MPPKFQAPSINDMEPKHELVATPSVDVERLKQSLTADELARAKNDFINIRKSFHASYHTLTSANQVFIDSLKVLIISNIIAERF